MDTIREPSPGRARPNVAALVLNWCAEEDTRACIASLLGQGYPSLSICVLDNASPDGSGARLAGVSGAARFIQTGANLGYAGGNAVGIQWALDSGADFILVINDDAALGPGALESLVDALEANPLAGMAAPTVVHRDAPDRCWWAGGHLVRWKAVGVNGQFGEPAPPVGPAQSVTFVSGCVVLLRATALRQCGAFDPVFVSYGEDVDLSLRFAAAGWLLLHVPSAKATHAVPWPPAPPTPFALEHRDRNRRRIAHRHLGALERVAFCAWFHPTRIALMIARALRGDWPRARALWRGAFSSLASPAR